MSELPATKLFNTLALARKVDKAYVSKDLEYMQCHPLFKWITLEVNPYLEQGSIVAIDENRFELDAILTPYPTLWDSFKKPPKPF